MDRAGRAWRALSARLPHDRALLEWIGVCLLTVTLAIAATTSDMTRRVDGIVFDALASATRGQPSAEIVIVGIDDRSLEALGRWPWPRELHARLIDRLDDAGARAVAYDILFPEPASSDPVLAEALRRAGTVHLPLAVDPLGEDGRLVEVIEPTPELKSAAAGLGHVNLFPDPDGVVRRMPLTLRAGEQHWSHLMLSLLGTTALEVVPAAERKSAATGSGLIAEDPVLLRWRGSPGSFRTVSFVDVLRGETPEAVFAGRIVLVGMTASGEGDRYVTPLSGEGGLSPGVELQATLLNTLLAGDWLREAGLPFRLALALLPLGVALAAYLFLRPGLTLLTVVGLVCLVLVASGAAMTVGGMWLPPSAAVLGLLLSWPLWSWRRLAAASAYMRTELETFERSGDALDLRTTSADVVGRQVEAMKTALQQLRDLRHFIGDTLQNLPDATLVFDAGGRLVLFNTAADRLLGDVLSVRRDPRPMFDLLGASDVTDLPLGEVQARDGRFLNVSESPLMTGEGVCAGRVVRLTDVSEMRLAQLQRERALQLLSHDMRAPQVAILALLEQARENPAALEHRSVENNARRTIDLADSFIQLARAENQPLGCDVFDLRDIVVEAIDSLWPIARRRDLQLVTSGTGRPRLVQGDRHLVARALSNLIDNAVKFSPQGATVRVALGSVAADGDRRVTATIEDEGSGVPAETRPRLFEPFGRGQDSGSAVGLGLALVHAVAVRHGGSVTYSDRKRGGARFVIALPAAAPHRR